MSGITESYVVELAGSSWEGAMVGGEAVLSWAGETARFLSNPLFLFLVLRWIWRFCVWTGLLFRISRLPLQLTPLHPDRSAGLGFLAIYPSIFSGFVFALSCVIASSFIKELGLEQPSSASDLNASVQAVRELRVVRVDRAAVVQLLVAAGVPLLAVVAKQIPLVGLAKWIVGTIL